VVRRGREHRGEREGGDACGGEGVRGVEGGGKKAGGRRGRRVGGGGRGKIGQLVRWGGVEGVTWGGGDWEGCKGEGDGEGI